MNYKQIVLDIPENIYKELDKLSKHRVDKYLIDVIKKITLKPSKLSIAKLFDLFSADENLSLEHDKTLYR